MGPPKCGAPGKCPVCPPLKPVLLIPIVIVDIIISTCKLVKCVS